MLADGDAHVQHHRLAVDVEQNEAAVQYVLLDARPERACQPDAGQHELAQRRIFGRLRDHVDAWHAGVLQYLPHGATEHRRRRPHERKGSEHRRRDALCARQRMAGCGDHHELGARHDLRFDVRHRIVADKLADIGGAAADVADHVLDRADAQHEFDGRVLRGKPGQFRLHAQCQRALAREYDPRRLALGRLVQGLLQRARGSQHLLCVAQHQLARLGQGRALAGTTLEDGGADLGLKRGDVGADRSLRDVQPGRGRAKAAELHDRFQHFELAQGDRQHGEPPRSGPSATDEVRTAMRGYCGSSGLDR